MEFEDKRAEWKANARPGDPKDCGRTKNGMLVWAEGMPGVLYPIVSAKAPLRKPLP